MAVRIALRNFQKLVNRRECGKLLRPVSMARTVYTDEANVYNDRDPAPLFFDDKTQTFLKSLTGLDLDKVFRKRMFEKRLDLPKYEFLTNEELEETLKEAQKKAEKLLQMPPVVRERQPITKVLSKDPAITGYDTAKFVFCDITAGVVDRKRLVVVREPDGTLRQGSWEEQTRMNEIYNPQPGRKLQKPAMFFKEKMKDLLSREKYEFLLDRACAQYEPDDPEYQRICSVTYEAVDTNHNYQMLHSTRHYGPMCFYLAWHKNIDGMLITLIRNEKLVDCVTLIQLYQHLHKDSKSALMDIDPAEHMRFIKAYIEGDSYLRARLQLTVQGYEDLLLDRQQYKETVTKSHGL